MHDGAGELGAAHAGAAFAARREELGISQRELAKLKVISAPSLIDFEKGRTWPRERTRAKLEQVVRWPPGTLAKLSAGATPPQKPQAPQAPATDSAKGADDPGELLRSAVNFAAGPILARAAGLPDDTDPAFTDQVRAVLSELRQLEVLTARAVRTSHGAPEVIRLLREIRTSYDALMIRSAAAPGATLGQCLYRARAAVPLSVSELADALDLSPEAIVAAEADQPIGDDDRRAIETFIAAANP